MNALNELTLKLLTSKKKYNNYLANMMPDKSAEIKTFYDKVLHMRPRIQTLLGKYLDDPATQTTNELDDVIEQCLRTVVKHLEMRDYENKHNCDETDSSEEDVVLFGQASLDATDKASLDATDKAYLDATDKAYLDADAPLEETSINTSSFWGGRVNKQQSSLDSFIRRRPNR